MVRHTLAVIFAASLLAELLFSGNRLQFLENSVYDTWHRISGIKPWYEPRVVIASIDRASLIEYREDPLVFWGPYMAEALSTLRRVGAAAVGIDIIFMVSPESWLQKMELKGSNVGRTYDLSFRHQLNLGRVVLAGHAEWPRPGQEDVILPVAEYLYSLPNGAADVGLSNLYQDRDGVIRSYFVTLFESGQPPDKTFAALLTLRAGMTTGNEGSGRIGFVGPPGTVPRVSFKDLIHPEDPLLQELETVLAGKIVILSVEEGGFNDFHLTPYSGGFFYSGGMRLMSGSEIHANIIESMVAGRSPRDLPGILRIIWLVLLVSVGCFLFQIFPLPAGFAAAAGLAGTAALVSYVLFRQDLVLPLSPVVSGLVLSCAGILLTRFTQEERTRIKMESIFSPYLSQSLLTRLLAVDQKPSLGGEAVCITALFSDIRNFTALSETLSPEEVVEVLNLYFGWVCDLIERHGGMVDKFIGDAVMAIFNAPVPFADHPERALRVALGLIKIAEDVQEWLMNRFPNRTLPAFRIGVGIHTGEALMGNIGSPRRMAYTAIGDTVNIASRLEGLSKNLGWTIVASRRTLETAQAEILIGRLETIQPRGRQGSMDIVEILGIKETDSKREDKNEKFV